MSNYEKQVDKFKNMIFNYLDDRKIIYNKNILLYDLEPSCDVIREFSTSEEDADKNVESLIKFTIDYKLNSSDLQKRVLNIEDYWIKIYEKSSGISYDIVKEKMLTMNRDKFKNWIKDCKRNKHE